MVVQTSLGASKQLAPQVGLQMLQEQGLGAQHLGLQTLQEQGLGAQHLGLQTRLGWQQLQDLLRPALRALRSLTP